MPNINDPNYEPPPGLQNKDFETWYQNVIVGNPDTYDTRISKDQWKVWFDQGLWTGSGFKSSKVDTSGNPISGTFANPDMCPDGTVAYGQNMCAPPGYRQGPAPAATSTDKVTTAPDTSQPMTLQDVLMNMFQQRTGIFGFGQGRDPTAGQFQGTFGVDKNGNPLPKNPNLQSIALPTGGLLWGPDVSSYGPPAPVTGATKPTPAGGPTGPIFNWQMGLTGPSAGPVTQPLSGKPLTSSSIVNRAVPAGVAPTATNLQDVLTGSSMFGKRPKSSPLQQMLGAT